MEDEALLMLVFHCYGIVSKQTSSLLWLVARERERLATSRDDDDGVTNSS
jgi:hypothetical protein